GRGRGSRRRLHAAGARSGRSGQGLLHGNGCVFAGGKSMKPALKTVAGYIPGIAASALAWETLAFEAHGQRLEVALPRLTPSQLETVATTISAAARSHLASLPVLEIVDV